MFKTYPYESGDIVVCKDTSGPSCLVVEVVEKVLESCCRWANRSVWGNEMGIDISAKLMYITKKLLSI